MAAKKEMTPNEQAIEAMNEALYWARNEMFGGPCERCDPGDEGCEIWGEVAAGLVDAIKALGGDPRPPAAHHHPRRQHAK